MTFLTMGFNPEPHILRWDWSQTLIGTSHFNLLLIKMAVFVFVPLSVCLSVTFSYTIIYFCVSITQVLVLTFTTINSITYFQVKS